MGACLSLVLFLGQPGDMVCRLQLPLTSIFNTVAISIITFISLQILYVTEFPKMAASHLHILRGPGIWLFVLVCFAVQGALCGWFLVEGSTVSEYVANLKIDFVRSFLSCPMSPLIGFALIQGFNGAMALISFMSTFMAAKPLHQYNLARDITFASLIYCVIWVTFIPIYIGLSHKDRSIVHVSFNLASNFGVTMPRGRLATSARSDGSDVDIDGTESEIAKLQRQFRIMEGDRQAYTIQAREQIRKQQQEMENLLKEQEELNRNLGACKSLSRQQQDSEDTQSLRALLEQRDMLEEELLKEKQCQKESLTRFNEQLTKNCHLREELQTLHIERIRFQQLHNRLDKELYDVRKKIGETVNLSTAAYDARVEAQSKMTMMREKAVKDLAQYNAEMKELERVIAHECILKEFMSTKCSERSGQDEGHELGHRQLSELKEQRRMDSGEESLDALDEVFQRIETVTGEDNLDMLVTRFIQVEDQNFALFNFVNEQNNEAEALRDRINQTQEEIEKFGVASLQQEQDHRSLLTDIDEQQKETESQAEDYEKQASIMSKILEQIKTGVNGIFSEMECDGSVIEDMLGSSTGISENNIMSYLGLVEQKTNELLTIQAYLTSKDLEKDYNPKDLATFLLGQNPELLQQSVSIKPELNSVEYDAEESPVTDEEERPLSQGELRRKIIKGVQQKESSARQAATKASKISQQFDGRRRSLEDPLI
ncbi:hypothetical protein F7725_016885 [Dissostichus mawsoni]|uniref:G-protein coupled receptors family 3 profile domain-containing protein n=1 Tax=Dissostichus mawsoni TaxID=36200 RepID=A0A7J5Z2V4_DISMA|nr:hypothetical protein F7725_016885 [Dissostichus mawsoni]